MFGHGQAEVEVVNVDSFEVYAWRAYCCPCGVLVFFEHVDAFGARSAAGHDVTVTPMQELNLFESSVCDV